MAGYNRLIMMGNLTRDPELKQLASGQSVCRLGIASNRQFKNRQTGTMVQEVCYVDVDVWGAQADSCKQYLQKGRAVLVEGRLKLDTWEDPDGKTRSKHSIVADRVVFLSSQGAEQEDVDQQVSSAPASGLDPSIKAEKQIIDQIDAIKNRQKAKPARSAAPSEHTDSDLDEGTSSAEFRDEPPFQDDLPF